MRLAYCFYRYAYGSASFIFVVRLRVVDFSNKTKSSSEKCDGFVAATDREAQCNNGTTHLPVLCMDS